MIQVQGLHHVSILVTDLPRARQFYSSVLGLTEIERPAFDFPGAWYELPQGQLHLIAGSNAQARDRSAEVGTRGSHYALRVRSYRDTVQHLRQHGIACQERPRNRTPWPQIFLTDPDGNIIELNSGDLD
jgi:catechol 2,3-dioxygenase-like lactoylglutathione lyase family enzyme